MRSGLLRTLRPVFMVSRVWEEAVGPDLARRARPARVFRGILTVKVSDPAWMFQLQQMREILLERLRSFLKDEVQIEDLRITLDRRGRSGIERKPIRKRDRSGFVDRETAERMLESSELSDREDLKEALRRLMTDE